VLEIKTETYRQSEKILKATTFNIGRTTQQTEIIDYNHNKGITELSYFDNLIVHVNVIDLFGMDLLRCTSISLEDLKSRVASILNTFAPCVSLIEKNGKIVTESDRKMYHIIGEEVTLTAINNTEYITKMKKWSGWEWVYNIEKYFSTTCLDLLSVLDTYAEKDLIDWIKGRVLVRAAGTGNEDIVRMMLHCNIKEEDRKKALKNACEYGYKNITKLLLDQGIRLESKDGWAALVRTAERGQFDLASRSWSRCKRNTRCCCTYECRCARVEIFCTVAFTAWC